MAKICSNCGKECKVLESWGLRDGNTVCYDCCESIINKNGKLDSKGKYFLRNVHVLDLKEFQFLYMNPGLASLLNKQEILIMSPFKKKNYSKWYCEECGNEVTKDDNVCCKCNKNIINPIEKKIEAEQFDFERTKWLGKFSKKEKATVLMFDKYMDITKKILDNQSIEETSIKYTDINKKKIHLDFTKWQFMLAILALVVALLGEPVTLLLTPILLWMSYGKVLIIHTKNGNIVKIAYKKDNGDMNKIISIINERSTMNLGNQMLDNYEYIKKEDLGEEKKKFCVTCGTEISSESQKYCTKCGQFIG